MESATTTTKQVGIIIVTVVWFVSILCSALGAFVIARALSKIITLSDRIRHLASTHWLKSPFGFNTTDCGSQCR